MKADELGQFIGDNGHFSTIFDFCAHSLSDGAHGWYDAPHVDFKTWRDTILSSQINVQKYGLEANIIENHDDLAVYPVFFRSMPKRLSVPKCSVP